MGRRKIEIKAIKDDRNRSVTFLKRKGGLFKKAHELSVLCSVDVAVFVFGNNKKLYEYSSSDMRDMIARYQYHGGPNEHKGPNDFDGGDDDDDEEADGTPPRGNEAGMDQHMMPPQYHGQQQPQAQFPQIRHQTHSQSPPVPNGVPYQGHPGHPQRGHTPQPQMGSRPSSRNGVRRMGPSMAPPPPGPHGPHPGITYMPTPPIYNPSGQQAPPQQQQPQQQQPPPQHMPPQHASHYYGPQHQQQQPHHQQYMDDRRQPPPAGYAHQPQGAAPQGPPTSQATQHLAPQNVPVTQIQPPPQTDRRLPNASHLPPVDMKTEGTDRPQPPLLNTDSAIKKLSQRKSHSIFTPIEENRSMLSQHLDSFAAESSHKAAEQGLNRSQSVDVGRGSRNGPGSSPPLGRSSGSLDKGRSSAAPAVPETTFTPPSRSNSAKFGSIGGARPRLTVQIPDGASEAGGSASATGESNSPRNPAITPTQGPRHNSVVLPPPSPSASALLSAGATGPPNPFARPPPQQPVTVDTPASALPSRFMNNELLPSPSSFYPEWNFRANDSNTLPSPLNFATPVVGSGPSFLRDDHHTSSNSTSATSGPSTTSTAGAPSSVMTTSSGNSGAANSVKRKSDSGGGGDDNGEEETADSKRTKVE